MAASVSSVRTGSVHSNWVSSWTWKKMTDNTLTISGSDVESTVHQLHDSLPLHHVGGEQLKTVITANEYTVGF